MNSQESLFVERMGLLAEAYGLPRISGRIVAYLMLEEGAVSLDDMAASLKVTKPSISTNSRSLEMLGVLVRVSKPGDRRDYYALRENTWENMFNLFRGRLEAKKKLLDECVNLLPSGKGDAAMRMNMWQSFYDYLISDLEKKAQSWEKLCERQQTVAEKK